MLYKAQFAQQIKDLKNHGWKVDSQSLGLLSF